ncbi:MAG: hypothetical protein MMC23_002129 [Stictis urceolatum]|nr:hypothetical protein [Stictis urceolata]
MKTAVVSALALLLGSTTAHSTNYDPIDFANIDYPKGTGESIPYHPPPKGGWENVQYLDGTGATPYADCKEGQKFTSTYHVLALGDQVVNGTAPNARPTPGPTDAVGLFEYMINGPDDLICWNIIPVNFRGKFQSLAQTATHIHQAVKGANGPPRIAFPNPEGDDRVRRGSGCMKGPFTTGLMANGQDTGTGFKVQQIEDNPAGFFTDSHSEFFVPGVVRGQLA